MNLKKNQSGMGVVEAFLILIVVAMLGFIGWFVWRAQQSADKTYEDTGKVTAVQPSTAAEQKSVGKLKKYCVTYEKLCFNYPADWSVSATVDTAPQQQGMTSSPVDRIEVKNAAGAAVLKLADGYTGLGGVCYPASAGQETAVIEAKKTGIKAVASADSDEYTTADLYAVKIVAYGEGGFTANVYLTDAKSYVIPGNNVETEGTCFSTLFTERHIMVMDGEGHVTNNGSAMSFVGTSQSAATRAEAEQLLKTDDFIKAYAVLRSVTYPE